jgi:hypothetical protein
MRGAKLSLVMMGLLIGAASCSGGGSSPSATTSPPDSNSSPGVTRPSVGSGTFLAMDEVGFGKNGYVSLTNFTDTPTTLAGLQLCQGHDCSSLPNDVVDAGQTVRVATGNGSGLENVVAKNASIGTLDPTDGEVALYVPSDYTDPRAMLAYVQWGSTPHDLTPVAVEAGLWVEGSYAPTAPNAVRIYKLPSGLWLFDTPSGPG